MKPTFHIRQQSPLIDTTMEIKITNLPVDKRVKIKAEMRDNLGTNWESFAEYIAIVEGEVDLATAKPVSGTYDTVDVMGLFWSMVPKVDNELKRRTPLKPLETRLTLLIDGEVEAVTSVIRHVISSNIDKVSIREGGLVGTFFCNSSTGPLPTIIVLGGSEGGLREGNAALLASYGFNTLALAYFGIEDLPNELVEIPLDYIEKAIDWLKGNTKVDFTRLGILGTSKGGELALLSASMFSSIKAVVGYVPSGVIFPGISKSVVESSWKYKNESLPFAYGTVPSEVELDLYHAREQGKPISWRKVYQSWAEGEKMAEIPVENIQGSVLLISGGDDQLWPADLLCERVINRLKDHKHPYTYEHINFPRAGHSFGIPVFPTSQSLVTPGKLLLGGTPKDNAHAQFEAWEKVKVFFKKELL